MQLLQELIGIKKYSGMTIINAIKQIVQRTPAGIKTFSGSFGITLVADALPYVYKVWLADAAYEKYIELVLAHQDNPFFPKVIGDVVELKNIFAEGKPPIPTIKVIRLEKLKHGNLSELKNEALASVIRAGFVSLERDTNKDRVKEKVIQRIKELEIAYNGFKTDSKTGANLAYIQKANGNPTRTFVASNEVMKGRSKAAAYLAISKMDVDKLVDTIIQIHEACTALNKIDPEYDVYADMHEGNIMFRANGELVITDPMTSSKGTYPLTLF
jgi:hypothetical protein